jgi:hypothetical protein
MVFDDAPEETAAVESPFEAAAAEEQPIPSSHAEAGSPGPVDEQVYGMPEEPAAVEAPGEQPEPPPAVEQSEASPFGEEPMVLPAEEPEPPQAESDITATLTMADLYARQGYVTAAREIYERILATDPRNVSVKARLSALPLGDAQSPEVKRRETVQRLEKWLTRVARHEGRHV